MSAPSFQGGCQHQLCINLLWDRARNTNKPCGRRSVKHPTEIPNGSSRKNNHGFAFINRCVFNLLFNWIQEQMQWEQKELKRKEFFLMIVYVNSSPSDSCRHDKTSPVVTRTLYVVLPSDNEACMWHVSHSWKKGNHTTLEHCLWFWHQTKDPLFCRREGTIISH